jgi:hypothetical protein
MILLPKKKIVVLGMMSKMPFAGVVWQTVHYFLGFQRLGYDVYYVEAHGITPTKLMEHETDDSSAKAAAFISKVMERFGMSDRWAFQALHDDCRCFGLSSTELQKLYLSADLLINLHGGTTPLPEHYATGRLVYLETDPVALQIELHNNLQETINFLAPHCAFFTFGENLGNPDCKLPLSERFQFKPTRQPVIVDFWQPNQNGIASTFTTIGNWKQPSRQVRFQGEVYQWSKHLEFLKFLDLPSRTNQPFELALSGCPEQDRISLKKNGWSVIDGLSVSTEVDPYRQYIQASRGEFTVAKDENVRLRSGWFSDRSATYLASGRPVITQETGFSNILPTGEGLFAFSTMQEIIEAIEKINSDYEHHCRAALEIARGYFNYDVVLTRLLNDVDSWRSR